MFTSRRLFTVLCGRKFNNTKFTRNNLLQYRLDSHPTAFKSTMGNGKSKYELSAAAEAAGSGSAQKATQDDFVEEVVCQASDINDNEMKSFEVGGGKVLLVKQGGKLSAIANKCSHYGAPLSSGVLGDGRVRCPWHGACFNVHTGDIEEFPGLDSVPCFSVRVTSDGGVAIRGKQSDLKSGKRVKSMQTRDPVNQDTFVIVGAGAAGMSCAETLRQEGFRGRLVLITAERYPPYDRIKLSKMLDATIDKLATRQDSFYQEYNIELMLSTEVTGLDTHHKQLKLGSNTLNYTSLFLATGANPRVPSIPGSTLENVFVLRSIDNANSINQALGKDKNVVILGGSFIGMEAAAYCVKKVHSVTVVIRDSVPFKASLGEAVGGRLMALAQENGVQFITGSGLTELRPDESGKKVAAAITKDGRELPADVVIFGVGATPSTNFLKGSDVNVAPSGVIPVDEYLRTNVDGVYAGGDIAMAPVLGGEQAAIGHWQLAQHHGAHAARNMLGAAKHLKTVPFFWTMLYNKGVRYAGYAPSYEDVIITGSLQDLAFVVYYLKGDNVLAIATMGRDPLAAKFAERLNSGRSLTRSEAEGDAWVNEA
ncbi:apoptosis-inducing factor 3 isoform X1 [Schistocerca nitens]|uniref:apoptosis-inducing factor 3 isoform X1 n=2 Tax=Schistocerca nitens TaxID=7011 RepID=UPI0021180BB9|nr:apoptosis-inducing factor 3 isoform X1 [Schistocerca nitens]